jgi:hypothetical protein
MDGWTDMTKLIAAFCNFANMPKKLPHEFHNKILPWYMTNMIEST